MIKELYKKNGKIDILTDNKKLKPIQLLGKVFVGNIFDMNDYQKGLVQLTNYNHFIRTNGCTIPLIKNNIPVVECILGATPTEANLNAVNRAFGESITPYCEMIISKKVCPANSVIISSSYNANAKISRKDLFIEMGKKIEGIIITLAKKGYNVIIVEIEKERSFLNYEAFSKYKNCYILKNFDLLETANLINQSRVSVTHEYSDFFWLSYGIHNNTIYIKEYDDCLSDEQQKYLFPIPLFHKWVNICKHSDNDITTKVTNKICDLI
jgi:hypothetical protein